MQTSSVLRTGSYKWATVNRKNNNSAMVSSVKTIPVLCRPSGPAFAQEWVGEPKVQDITYPTKYGIIRILEYECPAMLEAPKEATGP